MKVRVTETNLLFITIRKLKILIGIAIAAYVMPSSSCRSTQKTSKGASSDSTSVKSEKNKHRKEKKEFVRPAHCYNTRHL